MPLHTRTHTYTHSLMEHIRLAGKWTPEFIFLNYPFSVSGRLVMRHMLAEIVLLPLLNKGVRPNT